MMKCLSLIQPWATLLCMGVKKIETRSWPTSHRGLLYIHASKKLAPEGKEIWESFKGADKMTFEELPRGVIFGIVYLENCLLMTESLIAEQTLEEKLLGNWKPGRFAWICSRPALWALPIEAKGQLQIWDFDPDKKPEPKRSEQQLFAIGKSASARRRKWREQLAYIEEMRALQKPQVAPAMPLARVQRKFDLG